MDPKHLEDKLEKALISNTEFSPDLKEEIWENIDNELFAKNPRKNSPNKKEMRRMKKQNRFIKYVASAAALALILIGLQTETGLALVDHVKEMFAPEKEVESIIEGIEEDSELKLRESNENAYVIYIDEERYKLISEGEVDRIVPKEPLGDIYPEVSMEIRQVKNEAPEALIEQLKLDLQQELANVSQVQKVESPVSGWKVFGDEGSEWDSPFKVIYTVSDEQGGSYAITQQYFLEAAEGHGARFDEMLKEFYIIEKDN